MKINLHPSVLLSFSLLGAANTWLVVLLILMLLLLVLLLEHFIASRLSDWMTWTRPGTYSTPAAFPFRNRTVVANNASLPLQMLLYCNVRWAFLYFPVLLYYFYQQVSEWVSVWEVNPRGGSWLTTVLWVSSFNLPERMWCGEICN